MKKFKQIKPVEKKDRSKIDNIQTLDQIGSMKKGTYAVYNPQPVKRKYQKVNAPRKSTPYVNTFIPLEETKAKQPAAVTATHDVGAIEDVPAKHDAGVQFTTLNPVHSAINSDASHVKVAKKDTSKKDSSWTPGKSKKFSEDNFYLSADSGQKMSHSLFDW